MERGRILSTSSNCRDDAEKLPASHRRSLVRFKTSVWPELWEFASSQLTSALIIEATTSSLSCLGVAALLRQTVSFIVDYQKEIVVSDAAIQVPSQLREIAERTIDQAEQAVTAFLDVAAKSVEMVPGPAKEVSKKTLSLTERNLKVGFEHTRKLLHASDLQEFMRLQNEFLNSQFSIAQDHMKQLGSEMLPSARSAAQNDPK